MPLTDDERIEKLKQATALIFEVETSYPDGAPVRSDAYHARRRVGDTINSIRALADPARGRIRSRGGA